RAGMAPQREGRLPPTEVGGLARSRALQCADCYPRESFLMAYVIDQSRCINCWWCRRACPTDTIHYFDQPNRQHWIDPEGCIDCDICAQVCPMDCITHNPEMTPSPIQLVDAKAKSRSWAR